jgi:hypothetical protein
MGWTRSPNPAMGRWEHVNLLVSGVSQVFHLKTIDLMLESIELNNGGCSFQIWRKERLCCSTTLGHLPLTWPLSLDLVDPGILGLLLASSASL